jgi:hypothetical protein
MEIGKAAPDPLLQVENHRQADRAKALHLEFRHAAADLTHYEISGSGHGADPSAGRPGCRSTPTVQALPRSSIASTRPSSACAVYRRGPGRAT